MHDRNDPYDIIREIRLLKGAYILIEHKWLRMLLGKRLLKTGLSVFLTAAICQWLHWPVVFAIITAIVTVEPTVHSSIQKGKIRLPAAALGAALAMVFDSLLGQTPLAYSLAAFFTIYLCHLLKWDDAIIVATLTSVNMIALTETEFFSSFWVRLGTTSIGLFISTLVNFLIFPPNFKKAVQALYTKNANRIVSMMDQCLTYQLEGKGSRFQLNKQLQLLLKDIDKCMQLTRYQFQEFRFHHTSPQEIKELKKIQHNIQILNSTAFHLGDLISLKPQNVKPSEEEIQFLKSAWQTISKPLLQQCGSTLNPEYESFKGEHVPFPEELLHFVHIHTEECQKEVSDLDTAAYIAYELLSIHHLFRNFYPQSFSQMRKAPIKVTSNMSKHV